MAIYYLKENLNEGLKDLYGDSCRAYIVTEGKNPFEEKTIELDQLKYNVEELKDITVGRMYICVEFIYDNSDEYDNAEEVLADDISAVNEYITNAGFKPKYIKYFAIISRDVKTLKSLLEIDYDESFNIKSYKGAMEDDEVIIKSLGDDITTEEN